MHRTKAHQSHSVYVLIIANEIFTIVRFILTWAFSNYHWIMVRHQLFLWNLRAMRIRYSRIIRCQICIHQVPVELVAVGLREAAETPQVQVIIDISVIEIDPPVNLIIHKLDSTGDVG